MKKLTTLRGNSGSGNASVIPRVYDSGSSKVRLAAESPYRWPAAISIGTKPTFNEETGLNERVVEAYAVTDE